MGPLPEEKSMPLGPQPLPGRTSKKSATGVHAGDLNYDCRISTAPLTSLATFKEPRKTGLKFLLPERSNTTELRTKLTYQSERKACSNN